jgi:hypothetical protein
MMADPILKARAAALFRELVDQDHRDALAEEKTRVERERAMARLRAERLAREGKVSYGLVFNCSSQACKRFGFRSPQLVPQLSVKQFQSIFAERYHCLCALKLVNVAAADCIEI